MLYWLTSGLTTHESDPDITHDSVIQVVKEMGRCSPLHSPLPVPDLVYMGTGQRHMGTFDAVTIAFGVSYPRSNIRWSPILGSADIVTPGGDYVMLANGAKVKRCDYIIPYAMPIVDMWDWLRTFEVAHRDKSVLLITDQATFRALCHAETEPATMYTIHLNSRTVTKYVP